jgi:hypothetical protein
MREERLDDEMEVVRHQAERVEDPVVSLRRCADEGAEVDEVVAVVEQRHPADAAVHDVEETVTEVSAAHARHGHERRAASPDRRERVMLSAQIRDALDPKDSLGAPQGELASHVEGQSLDVAQRGASAQLSAVSRTRSGMSKFA